MLGMIRFLSQIIQLFSFARLTSHLNAVWMRGPHLNAGSHCNAPSAISYYFYYIFPFYLHGSIVCSACVCDGTAQVTLGSFTLYNAQYNSWPAVVILISLAHALHNKYIQPFLFVSIYTVQQRPGFDSIYGTTNANLFISFTCNCKSQFNC